MAAFRDDMPLVAGVDEDWDEFTTGNQIMRPDWDFSPIRMRTMHHLPQIFFDTLRPERPDCPLLIPSSFSRSRDKKTLFHTPFLSRGRAVTLLEYRDAKIVFEVDDWFSLLPQAVQRYLLPLQSMYAKWYDQNVGDLTQNYSYCAL